MNERGLPHARELSFYDSLSLASLDTVSRGRARASVRKCPEQWRISKFAGGKEPTGLFARMRLLTLDEGGKGFSAHIPLAPSPRELSPKVTEGVALL